MKLGTSIIQTFRCSLLQLLTATFENRIVICKQIKPVTTALDFDL